MKGSASTRTIPTSNFKSMTNRGDRFGVTENPPPGAYETGGNIASDRNYQGTGNPLMAGIGDTRKREAGFAAKASRFKIQPPQDPLGPGSYVIKDTLTKSASTGGFIPRDKRGANDGEQKPGPGTYFEEEQEHEWNRKSFNIIFSDLA
jgi:hypothetical protein